MMMLAVSRVVMMAVGAVSAAFGLERSVHLYKIRSEAMEHVLDHMVGPNAENLCRISVGKCRFPRCQARRTS